MASDIFGVSGRAMLAALIAGERDPTTLADLARTRMRPKIPQLEEAFAGLRLGTFDDHHRFLLARMLARIDAVDLDIAAIDEQIGKHLAASGRAATALPAGLEEPPVHDGRVRAAPCAGPAGRSRPAPPPDPSAYASGLAVLGCAQPQGVAYA